MIFVTLVHEAAHAGAVLIQGGQVLEFAWLPTSEEWGHIYYEFSPSSHYSSSFIGLAPYLLWLALVGLACLLSLRRRAYSFGAASSIFFWLYVVPLGDIGNTAFPYLRGSYNDFTYPFLLYHSLIPGVAVASVLLAVVLGFGVQRRLYGESALSLGAYLVLAITTILGLIFAVEWVFRVFVWAGQW